MKVLKTKQSLTQALEPWRSESASLGFVPTMGALHPGHFALVEQATQNNDKTIVSLFVNPTQFDHASDFESYPRDLEADLEGLRKAGVDAVFVGQSDDVYSPHHSFWVVPEGELVANLCGRTRGLHFRGVATILLKLFNIIRPTQAYFGEKDFQQLTIVRRLVKDLDLSIKVVAVPTVRDLDGLALASRNRRLTPENRRAALALSQSLRLAKALFAGGETLSDQLCKALKVHIENAGGRVDYVEIVDPTTLALVKHGRAESRVAIAAFFGDVRLIDNCQLDSSLDSPLPQSS